MAGTTVGNPKADKKLNAPAIDWAGHPIRDNRGYGGRPEHIKPGDEVKESGAFPPAPIADQSRKRFSPAQQLREQLREQQPSPPITNVQEVKIVGGVAEPPEDRTPQREKENQAKKAKGNQGNYLRQMWAELRSNPEKMAEYLEKKKAGYQKWRAKRRKG